MRRDRAARDARRAAARRLGANWTELHRQDEEGARASPLHHYVFGHIPGVILTTAGLGVWRLLRGEPLSLVHVLTIGAASLGSAAWAGIAWVRRRRAARARQVIYTLPERRQVRDRTT